jgi:hypothetical protein
MQVDKNLRARLKREASKQRCRARLFKHQQRYANVHPTLKEYPQEIECLPETYDSSEFLLLVGDTEAETFKFDYRIAEHYFPLSMHLYEAGAAARGNLSFELLCRFISSLNVDGSGFAKEVDHDDLPLFRRAAYFFKSCKCLDLLRDMIVEVIATKMKLVSDLTNWVEENNRLQIVRDTVSPE